VCVGILFFFFFFLMHSPLFWLVGSSVAVGVSVVNALALDLKCLEAQLLRLSSEAWRPVSADLCVGMHVLTRVFFLYIPGA
jgi:hypothetical protein